MSVAPMYVSIACASLALAACSAQQSPGATAMSPAQVEGLSRLRASTRAFQHIDSAVAAGYPREVSECLVHEHHGAMGYHHVNRANLTKALDVTRPQILLYERLEDGTYRLNGVEFILPYRLWSRDSTPPVIMGEQLKREDNLNFWYKHVWAWRENPGGVFADFHPDVRCPTGRGKVYTPFERNPQ